MRLSKTTIFLDSLSVINNVKNKNNPSGTNIQIRNIIQRVKSNTINIRHVSGSQAIACNIKENEVADRAAKIQYHLL